MVLLTTFLLFCCIVCRNTLDMLWYGLVIVVWLDGVWNDIRWSRVMMACLTVASWFYLKGEPTTPIQNDRRGCNSERWCWEHENCWKNFEVAWTDDHMVESWKFYTPKSKFGYIIFVRRIHGLLENHLRHLHLNWMQWCSGEKLKQPCG